MRLLVQPACVQSQSSGQLNVHGIYEVPVTVDKSMLPPYTVILVINIAFTPCRVNGNNFFFRALHARGKPLGKEFFYKSVSEHRGASRDTQ
jgi:hypothetical protein